MKEGADNWAAIEQREEVVRARRKTQAENRAIPFFEREHVRAELEALPDEETRQAFRQLCADYREATRLHYTAPLVAVKIVAELARLGWKRSP